MKREVFEKAKKPHTLWCVHNQGTRDVASNCHRRKCKLNRRETLGQSGRLSKVVGCFLAGKIMLTVGYFPRLPAIIYIPEEQFSQVLEKSFISTYPINSFEGREFSQNKAQVFSHKVLKDYHTSSKQLSTRSCRRPIKSFLGPPKVLNQNSPLKPAGNICLHSNRS